MRTNLNVFVLALAFLLAPFHLWAQVCSQEDIALGSQEEVNQFQSNYGPCDELHGSLLINGPDIHDLSPLGDLVYVGNNSSNAFSIRENPALVSLAGMDSLVTVAGLLEISRNHGLENLAGLSTIENITFGLAIIGNDNLQSLSGLNPNLSLDFILSVVSNPKLQSLHGLEEITPGRFQGIYIGGDNALINLEGLPYYSELASLNLLGNENLSSLQGLQFDQGDEPVRISIQVNPSLTSLVGLENISTAGSVFIVNNHALTTLEGLNNLRESSGLSISENSALLNISDLESLESTDNILMHNNPVLSDCTSLFRVLDVIDHGSPGPGPGDHEYLSHAPDIDGFVSLHGNADGCSTDDVLIDLPPVEFVLTGSWFSPESSGEGFMIHVVTEHIVNPFTNQIGLAIGYFYGYDDNGDRFWLIGVHEGDMQWDQPIEFTATRVMGGSFENFNPNMITEQTWGSFSFTPSHCGAGLIKLRGQFEDQGPIQEKALDVIRLGKVAGDYCSEEEYGEFSDSLSASWFDPATSGQGLAIHKIDESSGIVYFYGFDTDGEALWLIGVWSGAVELGEMLEIPMIQVSGGTFMEVDPNSIEEVSWGVLRLTMDDCSSGTAELEGIDGTQMLAIQQLAPSLGLECW